MATTPGTERRQVDDRLLVDRASERLAHAHVVERRLVDVEVEAAEVGRQAAHDLDVGIGAQEVYVGRRHVLDPVGVAGLDGGGARGGVGVEGEGDAVEVGQRVAGGVGAPEVGVALEDHAGLRHILDEAERPGAVDDGLQVAVRLDGGARDDDVQARGQLREQRREGADSVMTTV